MNPHIRRAVLAAAGAALLLVASAPAALAHDRLKSSSPADKAKVKQVETIELEFTARMTLPTIVLDGPDGKSVSLGKPKADGTKVTARITEPLDPGRHRMAWRVVSSDGHPIQGELTFTVTAPPATPASTPTPTSTETAPVASAPAETAPRSAPEPPPVTSTAAAPVAGSEEGSGLPGWLWVALGVLVTAGAAVLVAGRRKGGAGGE
ncbi:copper resistance protein CopC [Nonomuraea sp. NPDC050643]|uniref:copper resistance CopC family protein n=1 Tax=Nonomuraea sp. NPDC050643 TaxID=3155660 RepID=UPI003400F24F